MGCWHILIGMTVARSRLLDPTCATWVHCTSRCVRCAFLCGDGLDHRKDWIEERLRFLARCFALLRAEKDRHLPEVRQ